MQQYNSEFIGAAIIISVSASVSVCFIADILVYNMHICCTYVYKVSICKMRSRHKLGHLSMRRLQTWLRCWHWAQASWSLCL